MFSNDINSMLSNPATEFQCQISPNRRHFVQLWSTERNLTSLAHFVMERCQVSDNFTNPASIYFLWKGSVMIWIRWQLLPKQVHHRENNHWNENVVVLTKFSSLTAQEVVILTTFGAASDENYIKIKTFAFQWWTTHSSLVVGELCCSLCEFRHKSTFMSFFIFPIPFYPILAICCSDNNVPLSALAHCYHDTKMP